MTAMKVVSESALCFLFAMGCTGLAAAGDSLPQQNNRGYTQAQSELKRHLHDRPVTGKAKNIILFIADSNSVQSDTALRILDGQHKGGSGEDNQLAWETFPELALVKTYSEDAQSPDAGSAATAILSGVKTRTGVIGVDGQPERGDCKQTPQHQVLSALELAHKAGMGTGIITTSRVTYGVPAAAYAHVSDSRMEDDSRISPAQLRDGCIDIATQAVNSGVDVLFGGGRRSFLPQEVMDKEGDNGRRHDGRDLIRQWLRIYPDSRYVWNQSGMKKLDTDEKSPVLGLFASGNMKHYADRKDDIGGEPTLKEMTQTAIALLNHHHGGYFLMVNGAAAGDAHDINNAARALSDGMAFNEAVRLAAEQTDPDNTLIIVTSGYSNTMVMQGGARRGNPVLGLVERPESSDSAAEAEDGKPYTLINYGSGPAVSETDGRDFLGGVDVSNIDFRQRALVPADKEMHSGADVALYARGPGAYLFRGTVEQNYIFQVMDHAAHLARRAD